jgi:4-hydroxy-4-methyl-2-oxoglutarate aldolase
VEENVTTSGRRGLAGFVGFRRKSVPPKEIVQGFAGLPTGVVSDALGRGGALDYGIKAVGEGMKLLGPAITLRCRPTSSLARDAAMRMAAAGDVLVIATANYTTTGVWGDHASLRAKGLGLGGLLTDGLCRDIEGIRAAGFPVFARGYAPNAPIRAADSQINVPVTLGGQIIYPGDIILGDDSGVVVIPQERAEETLKTALEIVEKEKRVVAGFAEGKFHPATLDQDLEAAGFRLIED